MSRQRPLRSRLAAFLFGAGIAVELAALGLASSDGDPVTLPATSGSCYKHKKGGPWEKQEFRTKKDAKCQPPQKCINVPNPWVCLSVQPEPPCADDCRYWKTEGDVYLYASCQDSFNPLHTCDYCENSAFLCAIGWVYSDPQCTTLCSTLCYAYALRDGACVAGLQKPDPPQQ